MNHFLRNLRDIICFSFANLIDVDEEHLELLITSDNSLSYVCFAIRLIRWGFLYFLFEIVYISL